MKGNRVTVTKLLLQKPFREMETKLILNVIYLYRHAVERTYRWLA